MDNKNIDINVIWDRIVNHQGQVFHQKKGKPFSYSVDRNTIHLKSDAITRPITKREIEKALDIVPIKSVSEVQHLQAPAYINGILMDARIRENLW